MFPISFANEVNVVMQQDSSFYIASAYIDSYMYKAILVKREITNENV